MCLIVVTGHAMLGVRAILLDFGLTPSIERGLNWVLTVVGAGTVVYGLWLTVTIISRSTGA